MKMKLTDHFTLEEFTDSDTALRLGIDNTPPAPIEDFLRLTAVGMEKVRLLLGKPIRINSGYRCPALNKAVGGSTYSDHLLGYAVDFVCPEFGTPVEIARAIEKSTITYGQLICEGKWVHISFNPKKLRETLTATFNNGKATYSKGLA